MTCCIATIEAQEGHVLSDAILAAMDRSAQIPAEDDHSLARLVIGTLDLNTGKLPTPGLGLVGPLSMIEQRSAPSQ